MVELKQRLDFARIVAKDQLFKIKRKWQLLEVVRTP